MSEIYIVGLARCPDASYDGWYGTLFRLVRDEDELEWWCTYTWMHREGKWSKRANDHYEGENLYMPLPNLIKNVKETNLPFIIHENHTDIKITFIDGHLTAKGEIFYEETHWQKSKAEYSI